MLTAFKWTLDKKSKKHICPQCGKRTFVRFIDVETGDYLPEEFGRCDREMNCAYFKNPYSDGFKGDSMKVMKNMNVPEKHFFSERPKKEPVFVPGEVLLDTLQGYEENTFIQNLLKRIPYPLEVKDVEKVISLYYLGTYKEAITFPFIDIEKKIRAIQVKWFDEKNHTKKTSFIHALIQGDWIRSYKQNDLKVSCLFGEHLLTKFKYNPVALVEAPKTAIYGTLYFGFPDKPENFLWLAVYNLSSLNREKCKSLAGRDVILFPDLSKDGRAFKLWSDQAKEIESQLPGTRMKVSDFLEQYAPEIDKIKGYDLADYLIKLDWRDFRQSKQEIPKQSETFLRIKDFPEAAHLNYHNDLQVSGYYDRLLEVLKT